MMGKPSIKRCHASSIIFGEHKIRDIGKGNKIFFIDVFSLRFYLIFFFNQTYYYHVSIISLAPMSWSRYWLTVLSEHLPDLVHKVGSFNILVVLIYMMWVPRFYNIFDGIN